MVLGTASYLNKLWSRDFMDSDWRQ